MESWNRHIHTELYNTGQMTAVYFIKARLHYGAGLLCATLDLFNNNCVLVTNEEILK